MFLFCKMLYIIKLPILVKFMQYDKQIYGFRVVSFVRITLFLRYNLQFTWCASLARQRLFAMQ